jgi:hypothetical protein
VKTEKISGRCLCGAVTFTAETENHDVSVCHCSMCNRWAGGISMFLEVKGAPQFDGAGNIGRYKSSAWGERGFCKVCGSSLFWKLAGEDRYSMSAGCIDDQSALVFTKEIYIEDKPAYYEFGNDTLKQTGEEAMAAFVGKDGES